MTLKVESRSVADLIPYAANSRTHSDAQVAQIAASIREFGWTNPILIDGDGTIVAGHGRLLAARQLGLAEVPAIVLDHLTKTQQRALVIADNKLAMNAGWDYDLLSAEIARLAEDDFSIDLLGFSEVELEGLHSNLDLSILDELEDDKISDYQSNVRKAIQIEFEQEDYEVAQGLVKFWREAGGYVGGMIIEFLQKEKEKL